MRAPRVALLLLPALSACASAPPPPTQPAPPVALDTPPASPAPAPGAPAPVVPVAKERLAADTPRTTVAGNTFIAPAGWSIYVQGTATILEAPEGDSRIALVDVKARDADEAVELAWKAYKPDHKWPLEVKLPVPDRDGWTKVAQYAYTTSPNEKRGVAVNVR